MTTLTTTPFNYLFDDVVYARVSATNVYGFGSVSPASDASGVSIKGVPAQMTSPTEDLALSTDTAITLHWLPLTGTDAGNSDVIAYSLYWDEGDATRSTADTPLTDALITTFAVTGVTGGTPYRFRVRARNIYGPGAFSAVTTVVPSDAPGKTDIATVQLTDAAQTSVTITWPEPDAHSSAITRYEVLFLKADGGYAEETTHCDGSQATIVSSRLCSVPMGSIRDLTSLPRDSLIRVKVRAFNARGTGAFSEVNTGGASIETEPTNLSVVSIDVPSTSNVATRVVWTSLTGSARGGKNVAVASYEVYWDQATNGVTWVSLTNTSSLYTDLSGLSGGVSYKFKVRAYNKYGEGPFTSVVSVQTS
jgi:hypothetical protein